MVQRSELAQEIIEQDHGFSEKWSFLIFLGILLLLMGATWFIEYPDIMVSDALLSAVNAPKEIVTRQEGQLVKLFVHNNEKVVKNEILGWIESTADHNEVLQLSAQLDSCVILLNAGKYGRASALFGRHYVNLGDIQQGYRDFITALQVFNDYKVNGFYSEKRSLLEIDIRVLEDMAKTIRGRKGLLEKDTDLVCESGRPDRQSLGTTVPQMESSLLSNEAQRWDKLRELEQLNHDMNQQMVVFQQAVQTLKCLIDSWKEKYILWSPTVGEVFIIPSVQEDKFLRQGELLGYIKPDDDHFYAETNLKQDNFGKIDTGLKVQLRFDAYPYRKFGYVEGTLNYISGVPSDVGFPATIRLDKGLVTSDGKIIPYKSGLMARAIIIIGSMRLPQRLFYNVIGPVN